MTSDRNAFPGKEPIPATESKERKPLPPIVSIKEFLLSPLVLPPELVHGIIHRGTQTMLAGGSKSYKTWTLLDLALSVSQGVPWWGRTTETGRTLYMNLEIDAPFFQRRLSSIADAKGLEVLNDNFDVWNLRGNVTDIVEMLPQIVERCEGEGYDLIVPDPIYKMLGNKNENAAGDIAQFLNCFDEMAVKTGAAVVYGHHFAKGSAAGKDQLDRASGSGVFSRYADGIITLTRHEVESAFTVEATLRNFRPIAAFVVRWQHPLMILDEFLNPAKLQSKPGRHAKHSPERMLAALRNGMTTVEWKTACGIGNTKFYELLPTIEGVAAKRTKRGKTDVWQKIVCVTIPSGEVDETEEPQLAEAA